MVLPDKTTQRINMKNSSPTNQPPAIPILLQSSISVGERAKGEILLQLQINRPKKFIHKLSPIKIPISFVYLITRSLRYRRVMPPNQDGKMSNVRNVNIFIHSFEVCSPTYYIFNIPFSTHFVISCIQF